MSTVQTEQPAVVSTTSPPVPNEIRIYSHSALFYWWPVWAIGYLLALITYFQGVRTDFGDVSVLMHPSKNLGVIFTSVFLLVLVMTHATVRGVASLTVIATILALVFLFAYLGWWDDIFRLFESLAIYMNLGFYVVFSTAVFAIWALAFFVFDRLSYWTFVPGQMIYHKMLGGGAQDYDTRGMAVSKLRDDLFRHWVLGIGSGDLHIAITGARKEEFVVPNVLFVGNKVERIQRLVAITPDNSAEQVVTAGEPS